MTQTTEQAEQPKTMVDLFSGTASMATAFTLAGYNTVTIDIFNLTCDMLPDHIDVIHMSPPCTCFSVAAMGHHFTGGKCAYTPKTPEAVTSIALIEFIVNLLDTLLAENPEMLFYIENPRGVLRKLPIMQELSDKYIRHTVTYCQYGDTRMKPTDWWTNNTAWLPHPMCKNGAPCHVAAPRGSRTGTQGLKNAIERGRIPADLCNEIATTTLI